MATPSRKTVVICGVEVVLYSLNGKDFFSSPISLIQTRDRRQAEFQELKAQWQETTPMDRFEIIPVPVIR